MFRLPFRQELYRKHLESVHVQGWIAYKALSPEQKRAFFDKKQRSGIHAYLDSTKEFITFDIPNVAIVDELIGNLFFKPELDEDDEGTEQISKANALKPFRPMFYRDGDDMEDGAANDEADLFVRRYAVTNTYPLRFWLSIDHVKVGLSFRQTAAVITEHRNRTKNVKLTGISDHIVRQYVRVLLAVALQLISNVFCNTFVWAFSLAGDASTHQGTPLLDQGIRVCFNGVLMNLHLVLVPFFQRHTTVDYVTMIKTLMNVLRPTWNDKLISISSDGETTMTGRTGSVATLLELQCTNHVLRVWCVPHQLDLVVKTATVGVDDGEFYKAAHAFSVHLRAQHNLIVAMDGAECPKDTTRWVAFGNMMKWIIQHRRRLRQHLLDKRPVQAPTDNWRILAASLLPVFETLATFTILQARNMVISQQRHEKEALVGKVCSGIVARSSLGGSLEGVDPDTIVSNGDWWIARDSICDHMHDQGSWVRNMFEGLDDPAKSKVAHEIGLFALTITVEGSVVQAERDGNNNPARY
jgi:hypothetical protein